MTLALRPYDVETADDVWQSPPISGERTVIHEEWAIVDRWWTPDPVFRRFREVTRNGARYVEMSDSGGPWEIYD